MEVTEHKKTYIHDNNVGKAISVFIKTQRDKKHLNNQDICDLLEARFGAIQTADNLKNKINRGNFGAQLFVMMLSVLNIDSLDIKEVMAIYEDSEKRDSEN